MVISDEEKYSEAKRELGLRIGFYHKQVGRGAMTRGYADRKIAIMRSIMEDYLARCAPGLDLAAPCNKAEMLEARPGVAMYFENSRSRDVFLKEIAPFMHKTRSVAL